MLFPSFFNSVPERETSTRISRVLLGERSFCVWWVLLALWLAPPWLGAQTVDATRWSSGTVGLSTSQWRTHEGDDLAWAQPGFDDHAWPTVELDELGEAQPGWRWYRLTVRLGKGHPHAHLLIVGGDGVYAAYVNGQAVNGMQLKPWYLLRRPVEKVIALRDDASDVTIALRTHTLLSYTPGHLPLFLAVAVGTADAIDNERAAMESQRLYSAVPSLAINQVLVLAGIGAFALSRSQRAHVEYLWLGFYLFLVGLSNGLLFCTSTGLVPIVWNNDVGDPLIYLYMIMQIEFTFSFAGRRLNRVWRVYEGLLLLSVAASLLSGAGVLASGFYIAYEAIVILPAALLLPVLLLVWYRKGNREAGWLILPSLLPAATQALFDIGTASIYLGWVRADFLANPIPLGPVQVQLADLGDLLFLLAIGVVMFFRFTRVSREQTRVAAELEAAREIQQRLVPAQLPEVAGYALEAAYFPAQEVGGDFYQVLGQGNGMQMVVVGDVSGKGLKAAMTGALALGALRTLAAEGLGPADVLTRLNQQLVEMADGGFVTCVCVRIDAAGEGMGANAGHLSPYRNGKELALGSDLPLGIAPGEIYAERVFRLEQGDRLTLLSDGVVEARDAHGALFGFERTQAMSGESAAAIAAAALKFGQEDDVTVLTLTRRAVDGGK